MKYKTRDFGELEIKEESTVVFEQPIFGFEDYKKYSFIYDSEIGENIVWLQSLDDPNLCFILVDPSEFSDIYKPELPEDIETLLGEGEYICWVILSPNDDIAKATVNLKSPIIINESSLKAAQIILEQDYPVRFPIANEED